MGAKSAVMLTFDVDGKERWLARARAGEEDFAKPPIVSMGEYGPQVGVPRILELLRKYDLPGGFFVPGIVAEDYPELIQEIDEAGHEIGHHGYTHANPVAMSDEEEAREFDRANAVFEQIIGKTPVGYRAPAADMGKRTLNRIIDSGFEYDSSLMGNDVPYILESNGRSVVELPFHWSTDDASYFTFNMYPRLGHQSGIDGPSKVFDIWRREFDACYERGLLLNLVCHPQIIGRPHRVDMLEDFVKHISDHSDVWVARPREIAQYWQKEHMDDSAITEF